LSNFANGSLQHVVQGVETENYVSGILYSNALSLESATGYLLVLSYANIVLMVHNSHWQYVHPLNLILYHVGLILHGAENLIIYI
jgi:hypothetical protein